MSVPQQAFLRDAMRRLNLTRDGFASRIGVTRRALDTWLLPDDSQESRAMSEVVERFVAEIVANGERGAKYTQSVYSTSRANPILFEGKPQLLSVDQFSREAVESLFRVADIMQPIARRRKISRVLEGAVLGNLFFEASTRTRVSFGAAFCRLGGSVCDTTGFTFSSMAKGESIYDTSRVISGYVDALVVRHPEQGSVAEFARATNLPVINGGDGPGEHPSQALLDLYTIQREFSRLGKIVDGAHIALVGDLRYGRTVHSLVKLLALYRGLKFTLISPPALEMPAYIVEQISHNAHVVEQTHDLVAIYDVGGHFVFASPSHERVLGWRPDELEPPGSDDLFDAVVAWGDVTTIRQRVDGLFEQAPAPVGTCPYQRGWRRPALV